MLWLKDRESFFRAHFAHLLKLVVFCGNFEYTSKGSLLQREGVALLASQKWWFSVAILNAPVISRFAFSGLALLAYQKWWFYVAIF